MAAASLWLFQQADQINVLLQVLDDYLSFQSALPSAYSLSVVKTHIAQEARIRAE